ncbi:MULTISPECIES: BTAD domain-containing putative transcriptional regulator [unclassified Streptomyces]|uniref:AfsR/SARP family transcriptional regulator n=1 Tax=unclassified Streptomyces TaxID=2593676 RepID=UPI002E815127|nr:BTAD domain-containing putative transcriptional regulator [Streptomyces sp. NBC_00589]WTI37310.1 tetratricopeptide repeat protein [Streptomyces sp. NBC_00775]WUB29013.1 tetratricopeptide repeat protein [Streptomyces sp. NBC_00589]
MRDGLRFGLLGPPVLYGADGEFRPIGSGKMRALLAALLLEPGRVVSVDVLKDALWGGAPPASAQASLQNHVTRLRRLLDDPERLRAVPPGYVLRVGEGELDVRVFEDHATAARAAHAGRDWERALRESTAALALWRGTPLSGLPPETGGHAFVQRLEEARLLVLEWRYEAELRLAPTAARLDRLAPELAALTAEHPLREAFHRLLMLVLHRTGRQAEALAVHRDLRARLVEELGVEPGPAVREAHLEILREHRGPEGAPEATDSGRSEPQTTAVPADAGGPPRPAQLPPPPAYFTGRADIREELRLALDPERRTTGPGAAGAAEGMPCVAVLSGMAGVGKSALALHAAHGLRDRFPDGQLYVNLHGATPGMTPLTSGQALAALLRDLGAEPRRIPEHPDAKAALLRSMLAPTRTLMVLDDAVHAAQVRPLLPAGAGCAVIVTSRSPLTALDGAHRFPLAPLSDEDSATLLRAVSGRRDGLDGGHALVELTGGLPLALRVVAARLAARRALTPDVLAGQLAATEGRLHHLEYDDLSVRRSLAVAHDALRASEREADRDAALALCRIGALDLPAYGAPLLARLSGIDPRRAEAALDRLVDVALLEETAYGRYAPHDLVRDFAREIAGATGATEAMGEPESAATTVDGFAGPGTPDPGAHDAAVAELALRWYAGVAARSLEAILEPGLDREDRSRPTASQPPPHTVDVAATPPFCTSQEAFAWGDLELENVVALVERYAETSPYVPVLVRLLNPYVQRSGRVAEVEILQRAALAAARGLGDEAAEAYALGDLAGLHFMTGRAGEALALNDEALAIWRRLGVLSWVRRGLNNRGMLLEGLGRYAESSEALLQSLEFSRELGDPHMEAITYSHLGNLYEHTDPRAAIDHHKRSLAIGDAMGDVILRHSAHCNIGYAHLTLGEPAAAVPHFEESLRILGGHGDWHGESQTRLGLVRALRGVGHWERASSECDLLLCRADRRADRYTGGLARHQRGLLLRLRGDTEAAYEQWKSALEALEETDSPVVGELRKLLAE